MRASITTFFDHSNYGAVLQAYALQKKIESFSDEACHIDFSFQTEKPLESSPEREAPLVRMMRIHTAERNARFKDFREAYLHIKPFSDELIENTDVFITGSDQVFNTSVPGWTDRFLLSFAGKKRKTSYAASLGDKIRDKDIFCANLKSFDCISVRENSSVKEVSDIIGKNPERVLDPVFLLDRQEWSSIADKSNILTDSPYLLFVMIQNDMSLYKIVFEFAAAKGLALKLIAMSFFPPSGFDSWCGVGVEDYLKLIRDAQLVVTSSFHALAFSIIFGKDFKVLELDGELSDRNCRQNELLELLGLSNEDNGDNCREKLSEEKVKSESWLKKNILQHK